MPAICARRGCRNRLPKTAIRHLDPYCSSICCRVVHGLADASEIGKREGRRTCKGCDGPIDEYDEKCKACRARKRSREGRLAA